MRTLAAAVAAAGILVGGAWIVQSGSASATAKAKPLPGLPAYTAGYRGWTKLNRRPLPRRSADPHDGTKNVYASKLPRRGSKRFPRGTVIVKEALRPGKKHVGLIAVMRKLQGANPRHNDWVMIEWTRDSATERFTELARGDVCTACHVGAKANDYVFTRKR